MIHEKQLHGQHIINAAWCYYALFCSTFLASPFFLFSWLANFCLFFKIQLAHRFLQEAVSPLPQSFPRCTGVVCLRTCLLYSSVSPEGQRSLTGVPEFMLSFCLGTKNMCQCGHTLICSALQRLEACVFGPGLGTESCGYHIKGRELIILENVTQMQIRCPVPRPQMWPLQPTESVDCEGLSFPIHTMGMIRATSWGSFEDGGDAVRAVCP